MHKHISAHNGTNLCRICGEEFYEQRWIQELDETEARKQLDSASAKLVDASLPSIKQRRMAP